MYQYIHHRTSRKERVRDKGAERIFKEIMIEHQPPKFDERPESIHPRSSMNPKYGKLRKTHTKTHYTQTVKAKDNLESSRRKAIVHMEGVPN